MRISATIRVIKEEMSGEHRLTGRPWRSRRLHISWNEPIEGQEYGREQFLIVRLRTEDVERFAAAGYKVGDTISGDLIFYPRQRGQGDFFDNDVVLML